MEWAWRRHGDRYSWMLCAVCCVVPLPIYLFLSFAIVMFENSDRYAAAAAVAGAGMLGLAYGLVLPGTGSIRFVERWAAGEKVATETALERC